MNRRWFRLLLSRVMVAWSLFAMSIDLFDFSARPACFCSSDGVQSAASSGRNRQQNIQHDRSAHLLTGVCPAPQLLPALGGLAPPAAAPSHAPLSTRHPPALRLPAPSTPPPQPRVAPRITAPLWCTRRKSQLSGVAGAIFFKSSGARMSPF